MRIEEFFEQLRPEIPGAVRWACERLEYYPQPIEFDGLVSSITLLLMDKDYRVLRSFKEQSSPVTWLYGLARRHIRKLRRRGRVSQLMLPVI